jgi:hypothetical protein
MPEPPRPPPTAVNKTEFDVLPAEKIVFTPFAPPGGPTLPAPPAPIDIVYN